MPGTTPGTPARRHRHAVLAAGGAEGHGRAAGDRRGCRPGCGRPQFLAEHPDEPARKVVLRKRDVAAARDTIPEMIHVYDRNGELAMQLGGTPAQLFDQARDGVADRRVAGERLGQHMRRGRRRRRGPTRPAARHLRRTDGAACRSRTPRRAARRRRRVRPPATRSPACGCRGR